MKKLSVLLYAAMVCCFFVACKKEDPAEDMVWVNDHTTVQKLKAFFNTAIAKGCPAAIIKDAYHGDPAWEKMTRYPARSCFVIPVNMNIGKSNPDFSIKKYLVIRKQGKAFLGEYVYLVKKGRDQVLKLNPADLNTPDLTLEKLNRGFVSIVRTPLQAQPSASMAADGHLIRHKIKNRQAHAARIDDDSTLIDNNIPAADCQSNGGTLIEIEWWYQLFIDGVLVYEEYLFSTYECIGISGGQGGGDPIPTGCSSMSNQAGIAALDEMVGEEHLNISYTNYTVESLQNLYKNHAGQSFDITRVSRLAKWNFYTLDYGTAYENNWFANFSGIIYKNAPNDEWKWESINFVNIIKQGTTIPCFSYVMNATAASPVITTDRKNAMTALNYSLTVSVSCIFGIEMQNFSGNFTNVLLRAQ